MFNCLKYVLWLNCYYKIDIRAIVLFFIQLSSRLIIVAIYVGSDIDYYLYNNEVEHCNIY